VSRAVCLRCDWQGETRSHTCPDCGAELYRGSSQREKSSTSPPPRSRDAEPNLPLRGRTGDPRPKVHVEDASPADASRPTGEGRPAGSRTRAAAVVAALAIVALAVFVFVRINTPQPAPATARGAEELLDGYIVYAAPDTTDETRLWVWNLDADTVLPGPSVSDPVELVGGGTGQTGWVGVTSRLPEGGYQAGVLRFLGPRDRVAPLGTGELVSWDAWGRSVVWGSDHPARGCTGRLQVTMYDVEERERRPLVDRRRCGRLLGLADSGEDIYLTLRDARETAIGVVRRADFHRILPNMALVSASPTNDLIVVPSPGPTTTRGRALVFRRGFALRQRRFEWRTSAGAFVIERPVTWAPDARTALAFGRLGSREGLFLLAMPGVSGGDPFFIGAGSPTVRATFTNHGDLILLDDGVFEIARGLERLPMRLPEGAPAPDGPMLWMPTLAYSD
jgi:hypothetical protein